MSPPVSHPALTCPKETVVTSTAAQTPGTPAVPRSPRPRQGLVMAALLLAVFLGMLDAQIVATALPRIVSDLGGLSEFAWVTTAYIIASSVSTPVYGKLGDLFGRKNVFLTAIVFFLAGSAASGFAQNIGQLIAFRAVQGIGAGGLLVSVLAIIGEMFPPREGARYYGYFSMVFAVSALAGPAVGGVLTDWLSWRSVFFINVPLALLALLAVGLFLHLPRHPRRPHIDYAGIALLAGTIICLTLVTSWGGVRYDWTSGPILGLGAATLVCAVLFIVVERRVGEPVIPLRLFRSSTLTLAVLIGALAGAVFLGAVNFLALFVQVVTGATPTESGLVLLPMMLGLIASSMLSTKHIARSGRYKWYPVASMALGLVAALQLASMDADTPRAVAIGYMTLFGIAAGLNIQVLAMAAQNAATRQDMGAVSATVPFFRSVGTSVGISVFAAIFYGRLASSLAEHVPANARGSLSLDATSSQEVLRHLPPEVRHGIAQAYADALTPVFLAALPMLAVGLVLALLLKDVRLRQHHHGDDAKGE
ncbi:MDR family MFS transporter [Micromonospora mangrovi]|uniref:MDR family MFS transporter n=2 Tax=Micromonospora TaxID=1873 RepID=A0AAU7M5E8_9ACTN